MCTRKNANNKIFAEQSTDGIQFYLDQTILQRRRNLIFNFERERTSYAFSFPLGSLHFIARSSLNSRVKIMRFRTQPLPHKH